MGERTTVSEEMLLAHVEWVRALAAELVHGSVDADDVAQETWRRALERPPRHATNLRHWLALATRNVARQLGRGQRTRDAHESKVAPPPLAASAAEIVERAQLQQRVVQAVLALDEPLRATILFRFFDGLKPAQIAARTAAPVETVKTRLKRGLAQLRDRLRGDFGQEGREWRHALLALVGGASLMTSTTKVAIAAVTVIAVAIGVAPFVFDRGDRSSASASSRDAGASSSASVVGDSSGASDVATTVAATRAAEPDLAEPKGSPSPVTSTRSIRGRVVDEHDQPVAGARVYCGTEGTRGFSDRSSFLYDVLSGTPENSGPKWRRWTSGADGTFAIDDLDPFQSWSIGAVHSEYGCGLLEHVSLRSRDAPADVVVRLEGGTVFSLSVKDPTGAPAADRSFVVEFTTDVETDSRGDKVFGWNGRTDEHGEVRLLPVRIASFHLRSFPSRGDRPVERQGEVAVGARECHLDVQLEKAHSLKGRGRVVALDGTPARLADTIVPQLTESERARQSKETIAVVAFKEDPTLFPDAVHSLPVAHPRQMFNSTDPEFQYGLLDLDHDAYELDLGSEDLRFVAILARGEVLGVAEARGDEAPPDVAVDLAGLPQRPRLRDVRFKAIDATTGKTLPSAQVQGELFEVDSRGAVDQQDLVLSPDDPRGEFTFPMPIGDATLQVYSYGYVAEHRPVSIAQADEPLDLVVPMLPTGGTLVGSVLDSSGKPDAHVPLRLYVADGMRPVWRGGTPFPGTTDSQGRFVLDEIAAARHVLVAAPDDGRAPVAIDVDASSASTVASSPVELHLVDGVKCTVELRSTTSRPCFASVRILDAAGRPLVDDLYPFQRFYRPMRRLEYTLAPGSYTVEAQCFGFEIARAPLVVTNESGAKALLDLVPTPSR